MLSVPCKVACDFPSLKPTANMFSFVEKSDLACQHFLCKSGEERHFISYGDEHLMAISQTLKKSSCDLPLCKVYSIKRRNCNPNAQFLPKKKKNSLGFLSLRSFIDIGQMSQGASQFSLCTGCVQEAYIA